MQRTLLNLIVTGALVCAASVSDAHAGTVIRLNSEMFGRRPMSGQATIYLESNRLRIDSNEGAGNLSVIYTSGGERGAYYWMIDFTDSSYVEIQKNELVEARKAIDEAVASTKQKLEKMSPEERKQAEKVLAEQTGFGALFKAKVEYKKISSGTTVKKWKCDHYQGFRDGEKTEEVWAADLKQLGIDAKDLKSLKEMADLFETIGQSLPAFFRFGGEKSQGQQTYPGFAVLMVSYEEGERSERWEITEIQRETFDAGRFGLPKGLAKKEAPLGP
jgi:hypothetical protein